MKKILATMVLITSLIASHDLQATTYYWDANSTTPGAGITPNGTWGTNLYWSTSSSGVATTANTPTLITDTLKFSAGTDTTGPYTVTLNGTQSAGVIVAQTGNLTLDAGTLALPFSTGPLLDTTGTATLTVNSTISINNSGINDNLNFSAAAGTSIQINGNVTALFTNSTYIQTKGSAAGDTGTVNINVNLGNDANFKAALQAGGITGGRGTLNLNNAQTLNGVSIIYNDTARIGTINLGSTVNTGNAVTIGAINVYTSGGTGNLTGAAINVNSAVTSLGITVRSGATLNVAGSLTNLSNGTTLGVYNDAISGATMKILQGGTASLQTINVVGGSVFTNAGTLTGTTFTLGEVTGNTSGKFVLGDATGVGIATLTQLITLGSGTANAVVGGNSAVSTLTLNTNSANNFSGKLGGSGANENNVALIKQGTNTLTLSGLNTYTGSTTVSTGTLVLADNASLNFLVGANGTNNGIGGGGTINLNGDFTFDLTGAAATGSWNIVNIASLTENFGATFTVASGFAETFVGSNIWTKAVGPSTYTFTEATGLLTAVPEPATWGLLAFSLTTVIVLRRRRMA
ncbi:MAG: beta strand repeat-containing protein [Terrimicrobiaceae bacterium]